MPSSIMVLDSPEKLKTSNIAQNAALIAKSIEDASGIPTVGYKRGPAGVQICIFSINQGALRIWPGAANFELIDANRKVKQIVFRIKENARTVTGYSKCDIYGIRYKDGHWYKTSTPSIGPYTNEAEIDIEKYPNNRLAFKDTDRLQSWLAISLPNGTKYSYEVEGRYMENRSTQYQPNQENYVAYDYVKITAKVPSMDMYVLAGYDEKALFICELPEAVASIEEAHDALMPKEAKKASSYKRQGEWFFVPVSDDEESRINNLLTKADFDNARVITSFGGLTTVKVNGPKGTKLELSSGPIEEQSSHIAASLLSVTSGKSTSVYASGLISDRRTNHHRPLVLNRWHRVYRNLEVVRNLDDMNSQRRRYWD